MHNVSRFFAGTLILAIVCLLGGCGTAAPIVGANAPDFTLMNQDSKSVSLKDYRGQWVVLYFYPADFGTRGTAGTRTFKRDQSQFNELHTAIIGVSGDDVSRHKAFIEKEQLPFTLLADPKGTRYPSGMATLRALMWCLRCSSITLTSLILRARSRAYSTISPVPKTQVPWSSTQSRNCSASHKGANFCEAVITAV